MDKNFTKDFQVKRNFKIQNQRFQHHLQRKTEQRRRRKLLQEEKKKLYELQEKLYADGSQSLLVVLQAMDATEKTV